MKSDLKILKLEKNQSEQFSELVTLLNEVFEESNKIASRKQLDKLLSKPDFHAVVAMIDGCMVGGLTAYELEQYYCDKTELYLYDIAVKTAFHNHGIGKELFAYLKQYAIENGIETIFVQAHAEEQQAVGFYESVIGQGEDVRYFNFEIKPDQVKAS